MPSIQWPLLRVHKNAAFLLGLPLPAQCTLLKPGGVPLQASIPAAATAAATIGLYAGVYTPLKQVSHWNTLVQDQADVIVEHWFYQSFRCIHSHFIDGCAMMPWV